MAYPSPTSSPPVSRGMADRLGGSAWKLGLVCAILAAAAIVFWLNRDSVLARSPSTWDAQFECAACHERFGAERKLTFPIQAQTCPKCAQAAAWELKYCSKCKLVFLPDLSGDPPRPPSIPNCPKCSENKSVGAYIPGESEKLSELGG